MDALTVTVLGTCGAWPEAGRAASGFLVETAGFRLVLDLGYATLPRLLAHCPARDVDAVVITHEHPDHCADLSALCRALLFGEDRDGGGRGRRRVPLYCPPGVLDRVQAMEPTERLDDVFAPCPLPAGGPAAHRVGPFRLETWPLPHHVPHAGVRLAAAGRVLAYTGDAGPAPALGDLAAGADLLIAGATLLGKDEEPYLLSAAQAGHWATRAGARRLLLTHFWPGAARSRAAAEASATYGGETITANESMTLGL
ncbi:MBL fold metallo-hydrolase [Actinacidiphila rubida]|uniref:Ribonuclease BN, tRNA processing enzyme n=1 Tax=Actinacidiphila rubida TaxID=310780 RepID=A0A1H8PR92_9ACTN|nr:MBL fold metallo-hydrolase [Actinacidiphila rubida]SEO44296.1 Ribonuclease BN, tRNA processing enzyme [Actinacidiphila rubida]